MTRARAVIAAAVWLGAIGCRPPATVAFPAAAMPPPDSWVLVGAGDIADCTTTDDDRTGALVKALLDRQPRARAFVAGDNAYPTGSPSDYQRCYLPTWGAFADRTIAAPGNHDWLTDNAAGFRQTFGVAADAPLYRSQDVGPWRVIVVDSDCSASGACQADSAQLHWLADELAAHQQVCTLVIAHHPRFSSGHHGPSLPHQPLWETLVAGGADVLINGHDHHYERFAPLDAVGAPNQSGPRTFIAGTGGRAAYPLREPPATGSEFRMTGEAGVLVLTLNPGGYHFSFLTIDGEVADRGDALCQSGR